MNQSLTTSTDCEEAHCAKATTWKCEALFCTKEEHA